VQFQSPDDGRWNRLKHVERLTEMNKLRNDASCWLYSEIILAMHGHMNIKFTGCQSSDSSREWRRSDKRARARPNNWPVKFNGSIRLLYTERGSRNSVRTPKAGRRQFNAQL